MCCLTTRCSDPSLLAVRNITVLGALTSLPPASNRAATLLVETFSYIESGGLTSESTPLHFNTDATSPPNVWASRLSSNLSLTSIDSHGNISSATTPNISNTTITEERFDREGIVDDGSNGDNRNAIPPMPIFSRHATSQPLPRHRQLMKTNPYHESERKSTTSSNSNRRTSCENQTVHSLGSKVKISTTLGLLVIGLVLSMCLLVQFAKMGSTPFHDTSKNNSIDGNQIRNGFNGDNSNSGEFHENQHKKHSKEKEVFDEEGRYIIEHYDALPTFSNFLPGVAGIYGKPVRCIFVLMHRVVVLDF